MSFFGKLFSIAAPIVGTIFGGPIGGAIGGALGGAVGGGGVKGALEGAGLGYLGGSAFGGGGGLMASGGAGLPQTFGAVDTSILGSGAGQSFGVLDQAAIDAMAAGGGDVIPSTLGASTQMANELERGIGPGHILDLMRGGGQLRQFLPQGFGGAAAGGGFSPGGFASGAMKYGMPLMQMAGGLQSYLQARRLQDLTKLPDPSQITSMPGYQAGLEAVQRSMAAQGYQGSGNMMAALAKYGGDAYNQFFKQRLASADAQAGAVGGQMSGLGLLAAGAKGFAGVQ